MKTRIAAGIAAVALALAFVAPVSAAPAPGPFCRTTTAVVAWVASTSDLRVQGWRLHTLGVNMSPTVFLGLTLHQQSVLLGIPFC